MGKDVKISTMDGGHSFGAYLASPDVGRAPAVIVIQEIFGVNEVMRGICDQISQLGYLAICPDLFWRQEPGVKLTDQSEAEWKRAFELFQGFDVNRGVEDLKATLAFMRRSTECTGTVGTVGYCLGGKLAYLMATRSTADCNVSYYGVGIEELLGEAASISKPLLMHVAEKDKFVPAAAQQKISGALRGNKFVQMYTYLGVDHAFARLRGEHYNKDAANLANGRTAEFFSEYLSGN